MGDGRSLGQFRNSLKNARDTFDALFDNGRIGWKDAQGRHPELSGRFARIHEEWRSRSDSDLESFVLKLAGAAAGSEETLSETMFARPEGGRRVFISKRNGGFVFRSTRSAVSCDKAAGRHEHSLGRIGTP